MTTMKIRTYSELITIPTFEERFEYLKLSGIVGEDTFGFDRYLNQDFYKSKEWRSVRDKVIIRDNACDLSMPGHEIDKYILIHHMNPISKIDILEATGSPSSLPSPTSAARARVSSRECLIRFH